MHKLLKFFTLYVIAFLLISCLCGLVYATVQQSLRQSANDPQIEIAEDGALGAKAGKQPIFSQDKIDLAQTLAVFMAVYDKDGNPLTSNAMVDGQLPKPPKGVFDTAKKLGEYRVTWQPQSNVRQALVIVPIDNPTGGFVVSGRSLVETEKRENQIFQMTAVAWIIMLVVAFIGISTLWPQTKRDEPLV